VVPEPVPVAGAPEQTRSAAPASESQATVAAETQAPSGPAAFVDDGKMIQEYRSDLITHAKKFLRYPPQAMERGWEGRVEIRVIVRSGAIESASIKTPSGYQVLDDRALDMVRRAQTRTPLPEALRVREFSIDIPVTFELRAG
jgi:protein TonB